MLFAQAPSVSPDRPCIAYGRNFCESSKIRTTLLFGMRIKILLLFRQFLKSMILFIYGLIEHCDNVSSCGIFLCFDVAHREKLHIQGGPAKMMPTYIFDGNI